jgi:hypothetical protein
MTSGTGITEKAEMTDWFVGGSSGAVVVSINAKTLGREDAETFLAMSKFVVLMLLDVGMKRSASMCWALNDLASLR